MRIVNLKRMGIALLSVGMIATMAACGNAGDSKDSASEDQVTIDIFQFKVEFKDQFEALAEQYEKANPDVKINIETVGGGSDYGAALKSKFSSGNEPTIYNVGGPEDVEIWKDKLADLSDTKAADAALDGTLAGVTTDDGIYGLPYNVEGYGVLYNKAIFEKAGIDAAEIKTLDDLEAAAKTLDEKKGELGIDAPFAFSG